jgi:hypothetical protein
MNAHSHKEGRLFKEPVKRFSLKSVIGYAARSDSNDVQLTDDEIRSIAAELDLPAHAVEEALKQARTPRENAVRLFSAIDTASAATIVMGGMLASLSITVAEKVGGVDLLITAAMFASVVLTSLIMFMSRRFGSRTRYVAFMASNICAWIAVAVAVSPRIIELAPVVFAGGAALGGTVLMLLKDVKGSFGGPAAGLWERMRKTRPVSDDIIAEHTQYRMVVPHLACST